jgi:hypothetical protein
MIEFNIHDNIPPKFFHRKRYYIHEFPSHKIPVSMSETSTRLARSLDADPNTGSARDTIQNYETVTFAVLIEDNSVRELISKKMKIHERCKKFQRAKVSLCQMKHAGRHPFLRRYRLGQRRHPTNESAPKKEDITVWIRQEFTHQF